MKKDGQATITTIMNFKGKLIRQYRVGGKGWKVISRTGTAAPNLPT